MSVRRKRRGAAQTAGRAASLMGAIKIERPGTQNHRITPEAFRARFKKEFRYELK